MKSIFNTLACFSLLAASPVIAEQRIELNITYPLNQEYFELSDRVYFRQDNQGYFEVVDGSLTNGPARCLGAGFGFQDGTNSIEGICIFGEGDNTFTLAWDAGEAGAANTWTVVAGTGQFKGLSGNGIASTDVEITYKALPLRQTHVVGTISFSEN